MDLIESQINPVNLVEPVEKIEVEDEENSIKFIIEEVTTLVESVIVVIEEEAVETIEDA